MTVAQACEQLMAIEADKKAGVTTPESLVVGVARLGRDDQQIVFGSCSELAKVDLGGPLHSMVVCAPELHPCENEFSEYFKIRGMASAKSEVLDSARWTQAPSLSALQPRDNHVDHAASGRFALACLMLALVVLKNFHSFRKPLWR